MPDTSVTGISRQSQQVAVWILAGSQALYFLCVSIDLTLTALVGLSLAPSPGLATLPLAMIAIVGMAGSVLTGLLSTRLGYSVVMLLGALAGVLGGVISVYAVEHRSFALLCVGTGTVGLFRATGVYIRYLAADMAPPGHRERWISIILCGGLLAAFVGPWLATASSESLPTKYAGSYLAVALLSVGSAILVLALARLRRAIAGAPAPKQPPAGELRLAPIPIGQVLHSRDFIDATLALAVAGEAMTMIMATGPLASAHAGHSMNVGASIIQWHLVGMFAPSLFSGALIRVFGKQRVAVTGAAMMTVGALFGSSGSGVFDLLLDLTLNGVGWNFLFVAGTSYLISCYPPGRGGRIQAVAEGVGSASAVFASLSASPVYYALGWPISNIPVAVLGVALILLLARPRPAAGQPEPRSLESLKEF